jgi:diketogulonate reductase-like aldo/keto reductase
MQVALAWLLQKAPNILLIPGTSSVEHLRENLKAATLQIPSEMIANLDSIGGIPGEGLTAAALQSKTGSVTINRLGVNEEAT